MRAIEGNRFSNRDAAKAAGIQHAYFAVFGSFGNGACKSLAWSRAAARIGIVTDTRYPGARCLRLGHGRKSEREDRNCQDINREPQLVHLESPFSFESLGWPPVEHGSVPATVAPSLPMVIEKLIVIKP